MGDVLTALANIGQSFWLDFIRRAMLDSGELAALVKTGGITGLTSNPSIFEKAIAGSDDYKDTLASLIAEGKSTNEIYEALVIDDIRRAADVLRPVYDRTKGKDGFVSLEVSPKLAHETQKTVAEAKRLWGAVDRPNLMIKVPATEEGMPAVRDLIAEGINVNVTLIFSLSQYELVWEAFVSGMEKRATEKQPLGGIASVASFFVSRIDSAVDARLPAGHSLRGKTAIANAKVAFKRHRELVAAQRWIALAAAGARPQRMLWASTSTKNPEYSDVLYVDELIGPNTVNTLPPETHKAFLNHGSVAETLSEDIPAAVRTMQGLSVANINFEQVCAQLTADGVQAFDQAFDKLLSAIDAARQTVTPATDGSAGKKKSPASPTR